METLSVRLFRPSVVARLPGGHGRHQQRYRDLFLAELLVHTLEKMDLAFPPKSLDLSTFQLDWPAAQSAQMLQERQSVIVRCHACGQRVRLQQVTLGTKGFSNY